MPFNIVTARRLAGLFLCPRVFLLLHLLGLQRSVVDVPVEGDLQADEAEDDKQDGEQVGLVVEDSHGLGRGPDLEEPAKLPSAIEDVSTRVLHEGGHGGGWGGRLELDYGGECALRRSGRSFTVGIKRRRRI
jgi:hypothetical protein